MIPFKTFLRNVDSFVPSVSLVEGIPVSTRMNLGPAPSLSLTESKISFRENESAKDFIRRMWKDRPAGTDRIEIGVRPAWGKITVFFFQ